MQPEFWTSTVDTSEAAAFGTLKVPCRLHTTFVEAEGKMVTRFHMALQSVDKVYDTRKLRARWKSGKLEASEPAHPLLTILRGMMNRNAILDIQKTGSFYHLVQVPHTDVWVYARGREGLPGVRGRGEVIQVSDLKAAAALGTVGLRVLAIEGSGYHHLYHLPRYGPVPMGGGPPVDGVALLTAWNAEQESIPWENPFAQAMRGLCIRTQFLDAIRENVPSILITKPRSRFKSALVRMDATPTAMDKVKAHLDGA